MSALLVSLFGNLPLADSRDHPDVPDSFPYQGIKP